MPCISPLIGWYSIHLDIVCQSHKKSVDYSSDYETLEKTSKCTADVKQLRLLALKFFKAYNENCPTFIKDYFEKN